MIVIGRQRRIYSLREMKLQFALFVLRSKWINLLLIEVSKLDPPLKHVFRKLFFFFFIFDSSQTAESNWQKLK